MKNKTIKEHITVAEKLAKEHNEKIPFPEWLKNNGHGALYNAIIKYPDKFSHIKQDKKYKRVTIEEHIVVAEKLAKEHNGILPDYTWLVNNDYNGLRQAMQKYPDKFSHIKQNKKSLKNIYIKKRIIEGHIATAEKLAEENGGSLPRCTWLKNNGYDKLYQAIYRYPDKFSHIKQNKKHPNPQKLYAKKRIIEKYVIIANKLAKKNNGFLPRCTWLKNNGYNKLYDLTLKHPDKFSHIKRERRTIEKYVAIAEKLVKKNNGKLPIYTWLRDNGHEGLYHVMRKYPEEFSHIEQEKKGKSQVIEKHIVAAEKLAKKHNGMLPCKMLLRKGGHHGLLNIIRKYPEEFSHIEQEKKGKSVYEWIIVAEKLAEENGILPTCTELYKNGHKALCRVMKKNPKKFSHIEQEKTKTVDEWIIIAEELAKEHNGILPYNEWLKNNDYMTLYNIIRKYSEKFSHIKQERKIKSINEWVIVAEKLVKKHNGILPGTMWLKENNILGLYQAIIRYPEKFAHISRKRRSLK